MQEIQLFLKKGKEKFIVQNRHPWIFSGALSGFPQGFQSGDLASVHSFDGKFLAKGYFHSKNSLSGRILSFEDNPIEKIIKDNLSKAWLLRKSLFRFETTNCFRLVNSEEDWLPGLIVDVYDKTFVIQISTLGMEKLKELVVSCLVSLFHPESIYEKSTSSSRAQEGLAEKQGLLYGKDVNEVVVIENNIRFIVSIKEGQKTGFFLDQREMRKVVGEISYKKRVLNCFSYSGGFSLYALKGGAEYVTSVDVSQSALALAQRNTEINEIPLSSHEVVQKDVFSFLDHCAIDQYDVIILDPPAFAKKKKDVDAASKGYRQLTEKVLKRVKPGTLVLSCSCSYFIDEILFRQLMFQASSSSQRDVRILSQHISAPDHAVSIYHPEGHYLKSFLFSVF